MSQRAPVEAFAGRSGLSIGAVMTTVTRFAPSPTGRLHVGNIRTALHNWLLAARRGGRFLLRIDDTDRERSREEFVDAIRADLDWLGLTRDGEVRQSERFELYEREFARLAAAGRVYPCYETAQELELKRKVRLGRGLPPIYDRAALQLSAEQREAKEAAGERPHWRFLLDHGAAIAWDDGIRGPQKFDPGQMSDPVVRRADGSWLYMLPSVIDDIEMGVTEILRGEDHVSNTAAQLQMFEALDAEAPRFAHEALLVGTEGKLSKRLGSLSVSELRKTGIEPEALVALLARLGTSLPVEPIAERRDLIETFDLGTFGRAPARFDEAELHRLNAAIVHRLPYARVSHLLPEGMGDAGWEVIRPNLSHVSEAAEWWQIVTGPVAPPSCSDEDRAYLAAAAEALAGQEWGEDPWRPLTGALKERTGRKGKDLFRPLRLALTGREHGPDMAALLPLIGREQALARLRAAAAS
jgi:glutamyl-tRNA synthetase